MLLGKFNNVCFFLYFYRGKIICIYRYGIYDENVVSRRWIIFEFNLLVLIKILFILEFYLEENKINIIKYIGFFYFIIFVLRFLY